MTPLALTRRGLLRGLAGAGIAGVAGISGAGCSNLAAGLRPGGATDGTVQHMAWSSNEDERELYVALFEAFEQNNPGQRVQYIHAPNDYTTKVQAMMAGRILPDLFWADVPYAPLWWESGQIEPLDDIIADHPDLTDGFVPGLLEYGRGEDGRQYSIPKDYNPIVLYYNPEQFDEAGVPYPTPDLTLAEFAELVERLTIFDGGRDGDVTRFGVAFDNWAALWMQFIGNHGGECFTGGRSTFTDPVVRDGLTYMVELYRNRYAPNPTASQQSGQTSVQMFMLGRCAMLLSGKWEVPELRRAMKGSWDVTEVPIGSRRISTVQSGMLTLAKGSPRLDNAILLLRHMLSYEGMVIVNGGGLSIPPYSRMITDPKIVNEPPSVDAFVASAGYVGYQSQIELARTTRHQEFIGKYAQPELDHIFSFRKSVTEGTAAIDEAANAGLFARRRN